MNYVVCTTTNLSNFRNQNLKRYRFSKGKIKSKTTQFELLFSNFVSKKSW